jgi:hemerythrin-like domain-containing protein
VLHGVLRIVRAIRFEQTDPDFRALEAAIAYIEAFPQKFHHPKEELYLFSRLRERHPESASLLDRLLHEHAVGSERVVHLRMALRNFREHGTKYFAPFATAAATYAAFHWDHVRAEEFEVIPLAESFLSADDWRRIDEAFVAHADPLVDSTLDARCDALFREIVTTVPPPTGLDRKKTPR